MTIAAIQVSKMLINFPNTPTSSNSLKFRFKCLRPREHKSSSENEHYGLNGPRDEEGKRLTSRERRRSAESTKGPVTSQLSFGN